MSGICRRLLAEGNRLDTGAATDALVRENDKLVAPVFSAGADQAFQTVPGISQDQQHNLHVRRRDRAARLANARAARFSEDDEPQPAPRPITDQLRAHGIRLPRLVRRHYTLGGDADRF
jgi:hypothetical protein